MSDGLVIQCARVDRLGNKHVIDNSVQAPCARCRQRVWISPPAHDLATRGQGIKPICDVCHPALDVTLRDIHGDGP